MQCSVVHQSIEDTKSNGYTIKKEEGEEAMEVDRGTGEGGLGEQAQMEAAFLLFTKFTCEVVIRLKQYKDDLLAACLTFVLSLPKEIVTAQIHHLVPPLKVSQSLFQSL